jgi:uncharacterized protein
MRMVITMLVPLCISTIVQAQVAFRDSAANRELLKVRKQLTPSNQRLSQSGNPLVQYESLAVQGNSKAMLMTGKLYKEGIGTETDRQKAAEWFTKAAEAGEVQGWYNLGLLYKDASRTDRDYTKAFGYFTKAAQKGDEQSLYAVAYMHYKGLGCQQDYTKAAGLFARGAALGRSNSMYFYGLCLRNGYGLPKDETKAKQWLEAAAKKGCRMAADELKTPLPENSNEAAKALARQIKSSFTTAGNNLNQYTKIEHSIPANAVEGTYKGHLIKYDWSGQHAISSETLTLQISYENGQLRGQWTEGDSINIPLQAVLTRSAMLFSNTRYSRKDHYSRGKAVMYEIEDARLQWEKRGNTVYLSGNVQMFSAKRNEPEKPVFIALTRSATTSDNNAQISFADAVTVRDKLTAYPNPFTQNITVEFELKQACEVLTQLLTLEGDVVYTNPAGALKPGIYTITINMGNVAAGTYLLRLQYGGEQKTTKVVKQ